MIETMFSLNSFFPNYNLKFILAQFKGQNNKFGRLLIFCISVSYQFRGFLMESIFCAFFSTQASK